VIAKKMMPKPTEDGLKKNIKSFYKVLPSLT